MGWVRDDLLGTSTYIYGRTVERLEGLTDEEWAWEPVDWCWSMRRIDDRWQSDGSAFPPEVAPFTTIAWRLNHLVDIYGAVRNWAWLGLDPPAPMGPCTGAVGGELERLAVGFERWKGALEAVDDASLATKIGPMGGQYAEETRAALVLHQLDEAIHHGAEIGVVRDLYRARSVTAPALDTVPAAAANSRWDRVVALVRAGADVNGGAFSPLHLAVSTGSVELVQLLLDRGADTAAKDPQFDATPKGWAEFFGRDDLAALLS